MKDAIVGLKELRERTENYIAQVKKGRSFVVVRKSKPIFKIAPLGEESDIWENVVDFTLIKKGGVALEDVLRRI